MLLLCGDKCIVCSARRPCTVAKYTTHEMPILLTLQVNVSSFNASYGGQQAHAWTITFVSVSGDVGELVLNGTDIVSGEIAVTERVKVRHHPYSVFYCVRINSRFEQQCRHDVTFKVGEQSHSSLHY